MPTQSNLDTWDLVAITDSEITFETIHVLSPRTSPKETKIATSILNRTIDSIPKEPLSNKVTFVDIQIEEEPQAKKELSENIESPPLQNSCLKKTGTM